MKNENEKLDQMFTAFNDQWNTKDLQPNQENDF
jgi:hypothetical protein